MMDDDVKINWTAELAETQAVERMFECLEAYEALSHVGLTEEGKELLAFLRQSGL